MIKILSGLETFPKHSDPYLWCDYVELLCITSIDSKCSRGNVLELLWDGIDTNPDPDESEGDNEYDDDPMLAQPDTADSDPVVNDRHETRVRTCFEGLAFRANLFATDYPFLIDSANQEISLKPALSDAHRLYLQLLLSASLRYVPLTRRHELTGPFEALSHTIFSCIMPKDWEVHRFGAGNATRYHGHLYDRLTQLAMDLNGKVKDERDDYSTVDAGDGGLDLVAWHPMGNDSRKGIPIALAQCGCTASEWPLKALEASPAKLSPHLDVHHPWATYYFLPHDLAKPRNNSIHWQRYSDHSGAIMVDRLRLMKIASMSKVSRKCLTARKPVKDALAIKRAA